MIFEDTLLSGLYIGCGIRIGIAIGIRQLQFNTATDEFN